MGGRNLFTVRHALQWHYLPSKAPIERTFWRSEEGAGAAGEEPELDIYALSLLETMAYHQFDEHGDSGYCFDTVAALCCDARIGKNSFYKALDTLTTLKLVTRHDRYKGKNHVYQVNLAKLNALKKPKKQDRKGVCETDSGVCGTDEGVCEKDESVCHTDTHNTEHNINNNHHICDDAVAVIKNQIVRRLGVSPEIVGKDGVKACAYGKNPRTLNDLIENAAKTPWHARKGASEDAIAASRTANLLARAKELPTEKDPQKITEAAYRAEFAAVRKVESASQPDETAAKIAAFWVPLEKALLLTDQPKARQTEMRDLVWGHLETRKSDLDRWLAVYTERIAKRIGCESREIAAVCAALAERVPDAAERCALVEEEIKR